MLDAVLFVFVMLTLLVCVCVGAGVGDRGRPPRLDRLARVQRHQEQTPKRLASGSLACVLSGECGDADADADLTRSMMLSLA